jgi:Lrp/AsnC family leucine-responsive transcriptional regulator
MTLQTLERSPSSHGAPDKFDARILSALKRDGRISNVKLAEQVHLSPTAVVERVKRLQRHGYILGFQARLNPDKLGMGVAAFVQVQLDRTCSDVMQRFAAAVKDRPEVLECHLIAGSFDYLLKLRAPSHEAWEEAVDCVVRALPGVREARSHAVTEQLKK